MPTECSPIASTPVSAPSPSSRKNTIASTTSGTARATTIRPRAPYRAAGPGAVFPAASTATGTLITTASSVANSTIARVWAHSASTSATGGKSSGSVRDRKSVALDALSTSVATLSRSDPTDQTAAPNSASSTSAAAVPFGVGGASVRRRGVDRATDQPAVTSSSAARCP